MVQNHPKSVILPSTKSFCHVGIFALRPPGVYSPSSSISLAYSSPSWQTQSIATLKCTERIQSKLPHCEHSVIVVCGTDVSNVSCRAKCKETMGCCDRRCEALCGECSSLSARDSRDRSFKRTLHKTHPCVAQLDCGHPCQEICSDAKVHQHTKHCQLPCRRGESSCHHGPCRKKCSDICDPCSRRCPWCTSLLPRISTANIDRVGTAPIAHRALFRVDL